jgi:hypothetical protein
MRDYDRPLARRMRRLLLPTLVATALLSATPHGQAGAAASARAAEPTVGIEDFVTTPMTGSVDGSGSNDVLLSRINTTRTSR